MLITSRSNAAVKGIRALRAHKERASTGLYFVEGIRIVGEAVDLGARIKTLVVAPEMLRSSYASDVLTRTATSAPVLEVSADVFASISGKDGPQGIGAVIHQSWDRLESIDPSDAFCWVALYEVADPGNLGAIMRTCDAVGASGVMLIGPSIDPYDPAAVRASMGAIFALRLVRATSDELVGWKALYGCPLVGTSDAGQKQYTEVEYRPPFILLMGSEREGLPATIQSVCDEMVAIPMVGRSDSLNLAVATGVVLYEALRQRRERVGC